MRGLRRPSLPVTAGVAAARGAARSLTRPDSLAAGFGAAFVTLAIATAVDAATGRGVSIVAVLTVGVAGGITGALWVALPRGRGAIVARDIRRLLVVSTLALVVFAAVYLLAQRSTFGQRFERDALLGSSGTAVALQSSATTILNELTTGTVLLLAAAAGLLALVRRQWRVALAVGVGVALTAVSAEALKTLFLPRPVLLGSGALATAQSYPSGHVAVVAGLGAAAVVAAPRLWRPRLAVAAMLLTAVVGVAVLGAGWHRPSDMVGGVALAIGWFGVIGATMISRLDTSTTPAVGSGGSVPVRVWLLGAWVLGLGAVAFGIVEFGRLGSTLDRPQHLAAFIGGSLVFVAVDIFLFAALAVALQKVAAPLHGRVEQLPVPDGPVG